MTHQHCILQPTPHISCYHGKNSEALLGYNKKHKRHDKRMQSQEESIRQPLAYSCRGWYWTSTCRSALHVSCSAQQWGPRHQIVKPHEQSEVRRYTILSPRTFVAHSHNLATITYELFSFSRESHCSRSCEIFFHILSVIFSLFMSIYFAALSIMV